MIHISKLAQESPQEFRAVRETVTDATLKLRFTDGTVAWLKTDSVFDYFLTPIFLKYYFITATIVVLLKIPPDSIRGLGSTAIFQWMAHSIGTLVFLMLFGALVLALKKRGKIKSIYTPCVSLPSFMLTEYLTQEMLCTFWSVPPMLPQDFAVHMSRLGLVILLLDIFYGSFVAPVHPQTLTIGPSLPGAHPLPQETRRPAEVEQPPVHPVPGVLAAASAEPVITSAKATPAFTQKIRVGENIRPATLTRPVVLIGSERVVLDELILIEAEDHYLRIVTEHGNRMVRGKLASAVETLDADAGLQLSRSTWIARARISHARIEGSRNMSIVLTNGAEFTVARARLTLVKNCMRRWSISVNPI